MWNWIKKLFGITAIEYDVYTLHGPTYPNALKLKQLLEKHGVEMFESHMSWTIRIPKGKLRKIQATLDYYEAKLYHFR